MADRRLQPGPRTGKDKQGDDYKKWREENQGDTRLTCDFSCTWGYGMHHTLISRNQEYQMQAIQFWKEAAQDLIATFTKN